MKIESLHDNLSFLPTVAEWLYSEWGCHIAGKSLDTAMASLSQNPDAHGLPETLIGIIDYKVVAVARLVLDDMKSRADLTPWLASVFVPQDYRGKGYGSKICQGIAMRAKSLNINELYLFTPDRYSFYEKLGWKLINIEEERGKEVYLMKLDMEK